MNIKFIDYYDRPFFAGIFMPRYKAMATVDGKKYAGLGETKKQATEALRKAIKKAKEQS